MKCLLVYNPYSKSRKAAKRVDYIKNILGKKYDTVDVFCTKGVKTITDCVSEKCNSYDLIVVCGGDGTVNETINGLMKADSKTPIGIIPTGTCNDLAKMLNFSKNINKQLDLILNGSIVKMDTCKINESYYTYASAIGKYTDVSYTAKRPIKRIFGRLAYFIAGIREFPKYTKLDLRINVDRNQIIGRFYVILALNTDRVAGFNIHRIKPVKLNDGIIDLTLVEKNGNSITWPRLAKFFIRGDKQKKGVKNIQVKHIEIECDEPFNINADGELACKTNHVVIDVCKERLNIIVSDDIKNKYF